MQRQNARAEWRRSRFGGHDAERNHHGDCEHANAGAEEPESNRHAASNRSPLASWSGFDMVRVLPGIAKHAAYQRGGFRFWSGCASRGALGGIGAGYLVNFAVACRPGAERQPVHAPGRLPVFGFAARFFEPCQRHRIPQLTVIGHRFARPTNPGGDANCRDTRPAPPAHRRPRHRPRTCNRALSRSRSA